MTAPGKRDLSGAFQIREPQPVELRRPWTWLNKQVDGHIWVTHSPGKIEIPVDFLQHYDWSLMKISGNPGHPFGTKSMKSVFTTACRFLGTERCLAEQPMLHEVSAAFLGWNRRLYEALPPRCLEWFLLGDDVAWNQGLMMDLKTFERWIAPHWEALFDLGRSMGSKLAFHSDGDIYQLLPWLAAHNVELVLAEAVGQMSDVVLKGKGVPSGMAILENNPWGC